MGSTNQKILYVGHSGALYSKDFLPMHFSQEIDFIDWQIELKSSSSTAIKEKILRCSNSGNYEAIVLHLDYDPFLFTDELRAIRENIPIVGVFGDDVVSPRFSLAVATYCNYVLTPDPKQIHFFAQINLRAGLHLYEISEWSYPNRKRNRDIDILVYGKKSKGRLEEINQIKSTFPHLVIHDLSSSHVNFDELLDALNRSKITVNWSWAWDKPIVNNVSDELSLPISQVKGRVFEAALTGSLPITSKLSSYDLIFDDKLPTFQNRQELFDLINLYTYDEVRRIERANLVEVLAQKYLKDIQVPLLEIPVRAIDNTPEGDFLINRVVATYRFHDWLMMVLNFQFLRALEDRKQVRFSSIDWKFSIKYLLTAIKLKVSSILKIAF
jgi:hypothetical protein